MPRTKFEPDKKIGAVEMCKKFGKQDYNKLRDECLESGSLFKDPDFPAQNRSLYYSQAPPRQLKWKRPKEIHSDPQFVVKGVSRFDVKQGELGDCWLLAAIANLTLHDDLFQWVVIPEQNFNSKYAGIFHFRFWQYGNWLDVVIDDRLPTYNGKLIFLHSAENNEFWSALLEKAYAKLNGSYEALWGGNSCEAMEDFTGGLCERFSLRKQPQLPFLVLIKAYERNSLIACSIKGDPNTSEVQMAQGLVRGHAYSVTQVRYMEISRPDMNKKIPLLRLRNPWGNETEWNGDWSDNSPVWESISDEVKQEIGLDFSVDGEFWMSYKDVLKNFSSIEICNLCPTTISENVSCKKWETALFKGEWVRGITAGGCRNYVETFSYNPQYTVLLTDADDDDDEKNLSTIIVALMQKNRRSKQESYLTIGFEVYNIIDPENVPTPLDYNFLMFNTPCGSSPGFLSSREVTCRFKFPPGYYVIIPSTFRPNEEGEFILRVFTEKKNEMEERDIEIAMGEIDPQVIDVEGSPVAEALNNDKVLRNFEDLASKNGRVDWMMLKKIFDRSMKIEAGGFSKDVCQSMIAMLNVDRPGKLCSGQFKQLWKDIIRWKNAFKLHENGGTGFLCPFKLREALNSAGYRLNNHTLNMICHRYASEDGRIAFDNFMLCAICAKTMIGNI